MRGLLFILGVLVLLLVAAMQFRLLAIGDGPAPPAVAAQATTVEEAAAEFGDEPVANASR